MAKNVTFTPEAEQDSDGGYFWYESNRIGLGREFLTAVDACIQSICHNPKSYQVLYKSYRRAIVRRFHYGLRLMGVTFSIETIVIPKKPFVSPAVEIES